MNKNLPRKRREFIYFLKVLHYLRSSFISFFSRPSGKQWSAHLLCWGGRVVCYLCVCRCTHVYWCKGIGKCWCGDQRSTSASFFWCCHSFKTENLFKNIMYVYNVLWSHSRRDLSLGPVPHRLTSLTGQWTSCNLLLLLP